MQLIRKKSLADALAIATCSLLAQTPDNAHAIEEDVDLDLSFLEYRETGRVRVREMDVSAKWIYDEDNIFSGKLITDAITGSTPSGALTPSIKSQTLTSPSGVSGASGTGGGAALLIRPLEGIVDRRVGLVANWQRTYEHKHRTVFAAMFSNEDDYQSYGGSATVAYDLNQKLTTLEAGLAYSYDFVGSVVGVHKELGNLADDIPGDYHDGEKEIIDWGLSVTQILTRRSVVKVGYSSGSLQGYLSDPYKVVTLVDRVDPNKFTYFHEKRPTSRSRSSINIDFNQTREDNDVVNVYYRYYWDNWGISSHTVDARFRHELGNTRYLQPHVRIYRQSAADFFTPYLSEAKGQDPEGETPPAYASADNRLDTMISYTLGIKYGLSGSLGKFFGRYEIMRQIGNQGDYRNLTAQILQFVWTLDFKK